MDSTHGTFSPRTAALSVWVGVLLGGVGCGGSSPGGGPCPAMGSFSGSFNGVCIDFTSGSGGFASASASTHLLAQLVDGGTPPSASMTLFFPGEDAGSFNCGGAPDGGITAGLTFQFPGASYVTTSDNTLTPCTLTVTTFGAVGAQLTGTFEGTLVAIERSGNPLPPQEEQVTQGAFNVTRQPDQ